MNNGPPAHAGENQNEQTKLIEGQTYETMDTRGAATAIGVNQELETVGAINRPESPEGKAAVSQNGYKGGLRQQLRELSKLLKEQKQSLENVG